MRWWKRSTAARQSNPNKLFFSLGNTWFQNHKTPRWTSQGILDFWLALRSAHIVLSIPQFFSSRERKGRRGGENVNIKKYISDRKMHPFYKRVMKSLFHSAFWSITYQMNSVSTFSKSTISFRVQRQKWSFSLTLLTPQQGKSMYYSVRSQFR